MGHKVMLVQLKGVVALVRDDAYRRLVLAAPVFKVAGNPETHNPKID